MVKGDETFRRAGVVFTLGMILPGVPIALTGDLIVSTITYQAFLGVLALGFGLVALALVERLDLDRITFVFASFVWPWVVFFATTFVVLSLNRGEQIPEGPVADVVRTLWGTSRSWGTTAPELSAFTYPAVFTTAGLSAVILSLSLRRISSESRVEVE